MTNKGKILSFSLMYIVLVILATCRISLSSSPNMHVEDKVIFFKPAIDSLLKKGVDSNFIYSLILYPKTQFNFKYVKINVAGYLNRPDYSGNYNRQGINSCRTFIKNNLETLQRCESIYFVPKEIITAILWIETKNGSYFGSNHIPSVLLSTVMSEKHEFIDSNMTLLKDLQITDTNEMKALKNKIYLRARNKAQWAMREIVEMDKMRLKFPNSVLELEGSWAGAFGYPQFLPSSYNKWAVDGNGDGIIDLFDVDDAIFSIANYLRCNGWCDDIVSQRTAIYTYNNSNDYVDAVLKLAGKITS